MEARPTNLVSQPGIYDIPNSVYHADPCVVPSVSASILKEFAKLPRKGWFAYPRLNTDHQPKHKQMWDLGSASHKITLGSDDQLVIIDAKNYQTKKARQERDECYAADMIPVLPHQFDEVKAMAAAARAQLHVHHDASAAFTRGRVAA